MSAASSAVASNDWSTAVTKARQALALISGMPTRSKSGVQEMEWSVESIREFIRNCERNRGTSTTAANGTGVFGQMKIRHTCTSE